MVRLVNLSDTLALSVETRGFTTYPAPYTVYRPVYLQARDGAFAALSALCAMGGSAAVRAIEFKNVSFRYEDMPEPVLKNASFSLEYGKLALLYGDSGQGKSTVLSILSGVIPNVTKGTLSGEVRIGGEDVSGQRISDICRRAGVVLQNADAQIIHQRVEDELAFGCENFAFFAGEDRQLHRKKPAAVWSCVPNGAPAPSPAGRSAADHRLRPGNRAKDSRF